MGYDGSGLVAAALGDDLQPQQLHRSDRVEDLVTSFGAGVRLVWADTGDLYPQLLAAGVRVERCHDLRLCHAILADHDEMLAADQQWRQRHPLPDQEPTLLDDQLTEDRIEFTEVVAEYRRQRAAVDPLPADSDHGPNDHGPNDHGPDDQGHVDQAERIRRAKLRLLLSAESAGALIAAEMAFHGLPWDRDVHDRQLTELLGPRPRYGGRPQKMQQAVDQLTAALEVGAFNPDSPVELLQALHRAGIDVTSTRKWELEQIDHPAIEPLLRFKKMSRLLSANGWLWLDAWVKDGRFRPDYVVGGVVTGRWATSGGGALQLPKQLRAAAQADPGWKLVVADASQLEPRVLAAMARDDRLATAARGNDLYQGLVDAGVVDTRPHAKVAMLGALYGATTGQSGQLMPRLISAYPRATGLVEDAARAGERGEVVSTFLGRRSPLPSESWRELQHFAGSGDASAEDVRRSRQQARDWGRFTRNFVVQGTAAEWALCWMAGLRQRLVDLDPAAGDSGPGDHGRLDHSRIDHDRAHLVYFLHDEVIVHSPAGCADRVAELIKESAAAAGRLLFGDSGVEFALDLDIVDNYGQVS
ncbi:DNA polymerase-1 [Microlunatus soli]|uniref:DNA-directed DNA polymerase n=1 Tax=Microlunatus soli TaxID=630515 RepID=A0A1H1VHE7_9ACTN|nr:DNA polymerase-1 [Microlunatus soli]